MYCKAKFRLGGEIVILSLIDRFDKMKRTSKAQTDPCLHLKSIANILLLKNIFAALTKSVLLTYKNV